jgi:hypothetical protein
LVEKPRREFDVPCSSIELRLDDVVEVEVLGF